MQVHPKYKQPYIFLADDDEDDVYFAKTAFRELDKEINVYRFDNGQSLLNGLNKSKDDLPNFVLLDLNMPILDGRETLRQIRRISRYDNLPIIILSTSNHAHERKLCIEYGATGYYTKPCNYPMYLEIIKKLKHEWIDKVEA